VREMIGLDKWQAKRKANGKAKAASTGNPGDVLAAMSARAALDFNRKDKPTRFPNSRDSGQAAPPAKIIATYDYRSDDGELRYQVQRKSDKTFIQRRPDGKGGFIYSDVFNGVERVPYRLADLIKFPNANVFVVEGEKDADNVAALDLCAITVAGGAWDAGCTTPLAGRDVYILEDNDEKGREKSLAGANALINIANSVRIISFSELPRTSDVTDWLAIAGNDKAALEARCVSAPAWTPGTILAPVPKKELPAVVIEPLKFVDFESWNVADGAPEQEWGLDEIFAMRTVGMFSGEGGAGKSLLSMQLAIAHAIGNDWLGSAVLNGPFVYLSAEDDAAEMQRRQTSILRSMDADFAELKDKMHLLDYVGEDCVLGVPDGAGLIKPTKLFERLLHASIEIQPVVIFLDTSADVYAGNENDRAQVRQFISMLRKLALLSNAYVLVNSHVSLTGITSGSGLSGSTGWHNSVRSRMYLTAPLPQGKKGGDDEDVEPADTNLRRLEFMKSNYSKIGKAIDLEWYKGIYRPVAQLGKAERATADTAADGVFLGLLERFNEQGNNVSHKPTARNYAPMMFAKEISAKASGLKKVQFERAQRRLFEAKKIEVQTYGPPSHPVDRLIVAPKLS
jgi:RecA-family ATPase